MTYIKVQLYVSSVVLGKLPPHSKSREAIIDSDDEDPDGLRDDPSAGGDDGPRGGDGGGEVLIFEQPA